MKRYAFFFAALILGLSAGLYYGWVVNPVEGLQSSADTLRLDYQADYVLVVSEIFASDQRPDRAIERLRLLETENPLDAIAMALDFANLNGMPKDDLARIQALDDAIRAWEPRLAETASP
jgi:hypothetical protein